MARTVGQFDSISKEVEKISAICQNLIVLRLTKEIFTILDIITCDPTS